MDTDQEHLRSDLDAEKGDVLQVARGNNRGEYWSKRKSAAHLQTYQPTNLLTIPPPRVGRPGPEV